MKHFPKLRYPLDRRNMNLEAGLILLAYDMIWRWREKASIGHLDTFEGLTMLHDTESNLAGLGCFIEEILGKDRFDEESVKMCEWKNMIAAENNRKKVGDETSPTNKPE